MIKIAIVGKRAVPRTKIARLLQKEHGFKFMRMSDPTSRTVRLFYKGKGHQRWERRMTLYDALYKTDNDIHVRYALTRTEMSTNDIVIDDVRYVNELRQLQAAGYIIIRVESMGGKNPSKSLNKNPNPGTLVLEEYFLNESKPTYSVDYSMIWDENTAKITIAQFLLDLKNKNPL